jgi:hypothetical protein
MRYDAMMQSKANRPSYRRVVIVLFVSEVK